jgi:hypothetical protein
MHLRLATSPADILNGGKLFDEAQKGFSVKSELCYLKCIKKVIEKVPKFKKFMDMGGFGLKVGVDASLNLSYDDVEELKENELLSKFIEMDLATIFEQVGMDKESMQSFKTEEVELENCPPQLLPMQMGLKVANALSDLLGATTGKSSASVNICME